MDVITTKPAWLNGVKPDASGKTNGAVSAAIIVNDHGSGLVDAFYMYFYAFNFGPPVLGQDVDDHVGDWVRNSVFSSMHLRDYYIKPWGIVEGLSYREMLLIRTRQSID